MLDTIFIIVMRLLIKVTKNTVAEMAVDIFLGYLLINLRTCMQSFKYLSFDCMHGLFAPAGQARYEKC